jgi:DNA-binding transcriptional LysR family regulator
MISLHHLRGFSTIAAKRGIHHSINMLSRRYAPAVRSAAELEKILNIQLFECNRNGIMLTAAGEAVCLHARAIEAELRAVRGDAMHMGAPDIRLARDMEALLNHRCLRVVCMLADKHHLPRVARAMGMSHSAASQMIANLENIIGHVLFLNTSHGMVLSDVGRRWIAPLGRVLFHFHF